LWGQITKSRDDQVQQAICSGDEVFEDFSFTTTPFFLSDTNAQFSSCCKFDAVIHIHDRVSRQEQFPIQCKLFPEPIQEKTERRSSNTVVEIGHSEIVEE
jgi:hypothetical protein